ncbi:hypothetical protein BG004_004450 [Podila humilis]|nr:hypothetical protein BG004_004450 [Podila humilis]
MLPISAVKAHKLPLALVLMVSWAIGASANVTPVNSTLGKGTDADIDVCSDLWSRQECGYLGITKEGCQQRQCCWAPSYAPVPWCFQKKNENYVCTADKVARRDCGYMGIDSRQCVHVELDLIGGTQGCSRYGEDIPRLKALIDFETKSRIRVRILDRDRARYQVPEAALPNPQDSSAKALGSLDYDFKYAENPFTFSIIRRSTGQAVFETNVPSMDSLVYENEYLEISTRLPEDANIYGLGEVVSGFRRDTRGTRQTMWARDAATPVGENVYGSHPFYLEMRDGVAHGVFLRNSNGMDVVISPSKLTYKVIGGVFDFTVFLGPSPANVIDQYTELIGRPQMPPAWAMGFHQCRYGYKNIDEVETVAQTYKKEDLPLDGVWIDIDYMDQYRDFTFDELRFPEPRVKNLANNLAANNQSMVLIVDPGIPIVPGYEPYDSGMTLDVFVKNQAGKPIEGRVWPGQTYFPDFFNTNETWSWWESHLKETRDKIGTNVFPWIDMNEPSNFCNGQCTKGQQNGAGQEQDQKQPGPNKNDGNSLQLKYMINNAGRQAPLDEKTVHEDAVHKNGLRMYDTHNLYGHMESKATHKAMVNLLPNVRPFILSRSTFPGTGSYAAHWTGDNWSDWTHLYFSIPGILSFGLFGIPFTGADICGFIGNTNEELCLRWHQLGALYPFARNHNTLGASPQEAWVWPNTVLPAARQALRIRYSLLPYYYTLFDRASRIGTPVWQPLFFQYSDDPVALKIEHQFLLGDAVMVSPALYRGQIQVKAYFPGNGRWFDLWTHECLIEHESHGKEGKVNGAGGDGGAGVNDDRAHRYRFLPAKAEGDPIPMSIAGGHIIPIQAPRLTVAATRAQPVSLVIALDNLGNAKGEVYVDDGESMVNADSARVTWELVGGEKLVSSVALQLDPGVQGQSFHDRVGHSGEIEKITILGLNFARAGGETGAKSVFHTWHSNNNNNNNNNKNINKANKANNNNKKKMMMAKCNKQEGSLKNGGNGHSKCLQTVLSQEEQNEDIPGAATAAVVAGVASAAVGKKNMFLNLNVNGQNIPVAGDQGRKGRDDVLGYEWEVNQHLGSLSLTGLKINMFSDWFIEWKLK